MKPRLLTPGPTPAPEETLLELARPVTFHRSAQFRAVIKEVSEDLQYVFCTKQPVLTITASGVSLVDLSVTGNIVDNTASSHGGGVAVYEYSSSSGDPVIDNNVIAYNTVGSGGYGAGVLAWTAAKMIVEGRARQATEQEAEEFAADVA